MKYEEIMVSQAFDISPHGKKFMNPYDGCSMGCPYCYWLDRKGWEGRIRIKINYPEILEKALKDWPEGKWIFLGSVCDPFNELEEEYRLTQRCLEILSDYSIPLLITTSAVYDVVLQEAALLQKMKQRVVMVVELSRIDEIRKMTCGQEHRGIENANRIFRMGLETWVTIAPVCPGIIESDFILEQLDEHIPVYLDSLQIPAGSVLKKRVLEWIEREYPDLTDIYRDIIEGEDKSYFNAILQKYKKSQRIHTFPFDLS